MSEVTRGEILDIVGKFAFEDAEYRAALLSDPKAVLAKQMNTDLPDDLTVKVVEEDANTVYLIAPHVPPAEGDELSDDDLEKVAGGKGGQKGDRSEEGNLYICNDSTGVGTRVEIHTSL
ncbi:MAG: NHLP leader peptide family RiPP precursor [Pseudomonadota bacterium]